MPRRHHRGHRLVGPSHGLLEASHHCKDPINSDLLACGLIVDDQNAHPVLARAGPEICAISGVSRKSAASCGKRHAHSGDLTCDANQLYSRRRFLHSPHKQRQRRPWCRQRARSGPPAPTQPVTTQRKPRWPARTKAQQTVAAARIARHSLRSIWRAPWPAIIERYLGNEQRGHRRTRRIDLALHVLVLWSDQRCVED